MRFGKRTTLLLLCWCWPAAAEQDGFESDETVTEADDGLELGLRLGYGVPSGRVSDTVQLEERMAGAALIGFDLGYRLHPRWFVGGYGEYAIGFTSDSVDECDDCTFTWLHLALCVQYRLLSLPPGDLWVGLGTGHHWLNETFTETLEYGREEVLRTRSQTFSGPDYVQLQAGATLRLVEGMAVGPYSSLSIGSFDDGVARCTPRNLCPFERVELDVGEPGAHLWFSTGVRVVFLP